MAHQFLPEVFHRAELLQIKRFAFQQTKKVFHDSIVQAAAFAVHTLPDTLFLYSDTANQAQVLRLFGIRFRFLYKGIIIKHNKTEPTYTKTSLFLCEKRRFFMGRTEKGVVLTI